MFRKKHLPTFTLHSQCLRGNHSRGRATAHLLLLLFEEEEGRPAAPNERLLLNPDPAVCLTGVEGREGEEV